MFNFFIIFICLTAGFLFKSLGLIREGRYKLINYWVINVGLPSIALLYIPKIDWHLSYLFTSILPFIVFGLSFVFFKTLQLSFGFSKRTLITLVLVSGLSNTSFVGFPLIISYFGEEYLKVGIVSDQVTFFTLSTIGVILASSWKSVNVSKLEKTRFILKRIITFPPFIACCFALLMGDKLQNESFEVVLKYLVMTVSPLALLSIGLQLRFENLSKQIKIIGYSLCFKLLLAPFFCILFALILGVSGIFYQVSIFEMAMPSLVASSMIIEKFGLKTKLSNTIIGLSIIIGLFTSYFWYSVIHTLL